MQDLDPQYRKQSFKHEDEYFKNFEDRVIQRLAEEQVEKKLNLRWYQKPALWPVAASLLLVALALALIYTEKPISTDLSAEFEKIDSAELASYISSVELSDEEFTAWIPEETIDSLYTAEIVEASYQPFKADELEELEEEFSILDEIEI